jgi:hypothetical protein
VSLVKFASQIFNIPPLNQRVQAADDMSDCFDFRQKTAAPPK